MPLGGPCVGPQRLILRIEQGKAAQSRALALTERLPNAPTKPSVVAALYYCLYLLPAAASLTFNALRLLWVLSCLFLATAVRWL